MFSLSVGNPLKTGKKVKEDLNAAALSHHGTGMWERASGKSLKNRKKSKRRSKRGGALPHAGAMVDEGKWVRSEFGYKQWGPDRDGERTDYVHGL